MSGTSICEIDFEHWATLASSDPQKFEELRQKRISAVISGTTGQRQQRLLGLQWKIDTIRAQHKVSSVAACLAISEIMWDTFHHLAEILKSQSENNLLASTPTQQNNIIAFPENTPK